MIENIYNRTLNISNQTLDINELTLYTPSVDCTREWEVCQKMIDNFKADIISTVNNRFKIALILFTLLMIYKLWIDYGEPEFSKTRFYAIHIRYRIDFITYLVLFCMIGLLFI